MSNDSLPPSKRGEEESSTRSTPHEPESVWQKLRGDTLRTGDELKARLFAVVRPAAPQRGYARRILDRARVRLRVCWMVFKERTAPIRPRVRRVLRRVLALAGGFLLLLFLMVATAGWYTSRSEFCRSCHVMEPYYQSWQYSTHKDVSCIKCHFPPGFGEKVRGKMLGLVQLAKYVTRSEGPRPAAEIPDASCLRSGCHETRLLSGRVDFHGVPFDHTPHLEELRRGKRLRCTSCHGQIVQGSHMSVTTSSCFLCHFKEGHFNEGLGTCTRCHQIPEEEFHLGGGTTFNHDLAYQRGVDCANCHGDLIRGSGEVPRERCTVCHNREGDLARIDENDSHVFLHQKHVTDHKVDCLDCHLEIRHFLDEDKIAHARDDCASCHPNHHHEQVEMLKGTGAECLSVEVAGMRVVRIECRTCHRFKEVSATDTVLWKASTEVCAMCHDASAAKRLESYDEQLKELMATIQSDADRVRTALDSSDLDEDRRTGMRSRLKDLQDDLNFLQAANGIHNIHYASTLTQALLDGFASLCRELEIPEPEARLPETFGEFK